MNGCAEQIVAHSTGNPVRLFFMATVELNVPLATTQLGSRRVNSALYLRIEQQKEAV